MMNSEKSDFTAEPLKAQRTPFLFKVFSPRL